MINVIFLDEDFVEVFVLDVYESFIWTDRYDECGDFSILNPFISPESRTMPDGLQQVLSIAKYVSIKESDRIMIIEDFEYANDVTITGRSLESMLDRRIVWEPLYGFSDIEIICETILLLNVIDAEDSNRNIPNFFFLPSFNGDITDIDVSIDVFGEKVYDVIVSICKQTGVGWKILLDEDGFSFSLYLGIDRSVDQDILPSVEFSPNLNNLTSSTYIQSTRLEKTTVLAAGAKGVGDVVDVFPVYADIPDNTGLLRKETFVQTSISRTVDDITLSEAEYQELIEEEGRRILASSVTIKAFDGEVDLTMYNVGDEYSLGDIVEISDDYGHSGKSKVTEVIHTSDINGISTYPTLIPI